ncbi:MAG: 3-oxoacyl-[acyl-carrier-protein] synthase III C-terminal domain-containing protein, partial [Pseudomonadota bacterium]
GDGAGALVLEGQKGDGTAQDRGVLATDLHSDGAFKELLYVDGGVSTRTTGRLRMQGKEIFRHAIDKLTRTARLSVKKAGLDSRDIDWIVPHQANLRIIKAIAQRMELPPERIVVTVRDHGNTSAASIPLALSVGKARGQIKRGDVLLMDAIGGGLAWGSVILRW